MKPLALISAISAISASASLILASATALALPESKNFAAFIDRGPVPEPAGEVDFWLVETTTAHLGGGWDVVCRYLMIWTPPRNGPYVTSCSIDEFTWHGQRSCEADSQTSLDSILMRVPNAPCAGFDWFGVAHNVFQFVAGESDSGLYGTIQFTAAAAFVDGFEGVAR